MFRVGVRDQILVAHSLPRPVFGPAQGVHGATFTVDVEFESPSLRDDNIVIDIVVAHRVLSRVLDPLNYKNLDDLPEFEGEVTTTEFLARHIHDGLWQELDEEGGFSGRIHVKLFESRIAWASFSGEPR